MLRQQIQAPLKNNNNMIRSIKNNRWNNFSLIFYDLIDHLQIWVT